MKEKINPAPFMDRISFKKAQPVHKRCEVKILIIENKAILVLVKIFLLVSVATLAPLFGQQFIAGPLVNAALFISVFLLDKHNAILIGLIPSLIALSVGLLPAVLAPMIPFVMMGNAILILTFSYLKDKNFWLGVISASFLKFIFLFFTSSIVINLLLKKEIAAKVALMMSWPQLLTALSGGLLAYLFLKFFKNNL